MLGYLIEDRLLSMNNKKNNKVKKTLAFLCDYAAPYGGNFIASLCNLEAALTVYNCKCFFIFPKAAESRFWYKMLESLGKNITTIDFKLGRLQKIAVLNKFIKTYNISILHVHFGEMLNSVICGILNPNLKVIWHLHSDFSLGHDLSFKDKLRNFILFDCLGRQINKIAVSQSMASLNENTVYVPNAVAADRFYCPEDDQAIRQLKNNLQGQKLLLVLGWAPEVKGIDIAVEAVHILQEQKCHNIKLGIVCGRTMTADKMKTFIKNKTTCNGNEDWILYLKPIENIFLYLKETTVMLSTSRSEGFSYSILEALSLGKDCVISDIPGTAWAKEYSLVRSFKSEDAQSCAEAIAAMLTQNISVAERDRAKKLIQDKYSIEDWCQKVIKVYGLK